MKKWLLFLLVISLMLISGCASIEDNQLESPKPLAQENYQKPSTSSQSHGLGTLCNGEQECLSFCENNPGECEGYCQRNTENPLCQKIYSFEGVDKKLRKKIILDENEEKPVLSLPFNDGDEATGILPMGETISHNGEPHAGMDFFWDREAKIRTSIDGEIVYISKRKPGEIHEGVLDVFVRSGKYVVGHTELSAVSPDIYLGKKVQRGEWLGNSWDAGGDGGMIHWEFGYYPEGWQSWGGTQPKPHPERLCPMTYFDDNSRERIETIWKNANYEYRDRWPYICSGVFEGKDE